MTFLKNDIIKVNEPYVGNSSPHWYRFVLATEPLRLLTPNGDELIQCDPDIYTFIMQLGPEDDPITVLQVLEHLNT